MRSYVVGFLFSEDRKRVALIRKTHPEWQAGKLNGPGGKVEPWETYHGAMSREFMEEVGRSIPWWQLFSTISGKNGNYKGEPGHEENEDFTVYFFRAFGDLSRLNQSTDADEKLEIIEVSDLSLHSTISNLQWLIPMALTMELTPVQVYSITEV